MHPLTMQLHWADGELYPRPPIRLHPARRSATVAAALQNMVDERTYRGGYALRFGMDDGSTVVARRRAA